MMRVHVDRLKPGSGKQNFDIIACMLIVGVGHLLKHGAENETK
jgi:hypothetical protein